jgi:hypothetical protein
MPARTAHPRHGGNPQASPREQTPDPGSANRATGFSRDSDPEPALPPIRNDPERSRRCYRPSQRFTRPLPISLDEMHDPEERVT